MQKGRRLNAKSEKLMFVANCEFDVHLNAIYLAEA